MTAAYERLAILTGMPRSGTSWIGQIVDSSPDVAYRMCPLFSYPFKDAVGPGATREEWERVFVGTYRSDDEYLNQAHRRRAGDYPTIADKRDHPGLLVCKFDRYQHLMEDVLQRFPNVKMVGIVRHPCGAVHSWLTAGPKEFPADADPLEQWRSGACKKHGAGDHFGFADWQMLATAFIDLEARYSSRFQLLTYEAFVDDPRGRTEALFDWLGLQLGPQTRDFLTRTHAVEVAGPYSVFKSPAVRDRWRTELQPAIAEAILDEVRGTPLERFLG